MALPALVEGLPVQLERLVLPDQQEPLVRMDFLAHKVRPEHKVLPAQMEPPDQQEPLVRMDFLAHKVRPEHKVLPAQLAHQVSIRLLALPDLLGLLDLLDFPERTSKHSKRTAINT